MVLHSVFYQTFREGGNAVYTTVNLTNIENNREITRETYEILFYHFQMGVLLTLKEDGMLTELQYKNAVQLLRKQTKAKGAGN